MRPVVILAAALLAGCVITSPAAERAEAEAALNLQPVSWPVEADRMPAGADLVASYDVWIDYCIRSLEGPTEVDTARCVSEPETIRLTERGLRNFELVQTRVNETRPFVPEDNRDDYWQFLEPGQSGDCEDLAITKRQMLIDMGYRPGALRLAECRLRGSTAPAGRGHAVLTVETDRGTLVMGAYGPVVPWTESECDSWGARWSWPTWEEHDGYSLAAH